MKVEVKSERSFEIQWIKKTEEGKVKKWGWRKVKRREEEGREDNWPFREERIVSSKSWIDFEQAKSTNWTNDRRDSWE